MFEFTTAQPTNPAPQSTDWEDQGLVTWMKAITSDRPTGNYWRAGLPAGSDTNTGSAAE